MTRKHRRIAPVTLVVADCQNVANLFKHRHSVNAFVRQFGPKIQRRAYDNWCKYRCPLKQKQLLEGWSPIDVLTQTRNALDNLLIQDCKRLIQQLNLKTMVLIAGDKDFAPLIREFQRQKVRVIVIGRRNQVSKKLRKLVPHDIYAIEDLRGLSPVAA